MNKLFKILKEELVFIPALFITLLGFKWLLQVEFPESAQFDIASESETVLFSVLRLVTYTSLTWIILRVVFPAIYKYIRDEFYTNFITLEDGEKRKISLFIFFAFFFALILLSSCNSAYGSPKQNYSKEEQFRSEFVKHLESQLYIREKTGNNDGPEVEAFLKVVGLKKGNSWCAAYTSANLHYYSVPNPMSGWSPNFALQKDIIWSQKLIKTNKVKQYPQPGDCFTIYYHSLGRVGHVGFVVGQSGIYFITIEGNTNNGGSRDGDGVFKRKRDSRKVYAVSNYITPYINANEKVFHHNAVGDFSMVLPKWKNTNSRKTQQYIRYAVRGEDDKRTRYADNSTGRRDYYYYSGAEIRYYLLQQIRSCIASISIQEWRAESRLQLRCLANACEVAKRAVKNLPVEEKRRISARCSSYKTSVKVC